MSGVYSAQFTGVAVTAAQDFFELVAGSGKPIIVLGFEIGQTTDVGDAAEEILSLNFKSGQTTSGSGGSSVTPAATDTGNTVASAATCEANNTTKASAGTIVTHWAGTWNIRVPYEKLFTQEQQIIIAASRRCTMELVGAPADSITVSGTIWFQEIG